MRDLVSFFTALSDPTRLRLLHLMKDGEICVCFLQGVLGTNQPKISRHLAYLRNAGLVEARRDGKWMHYSLKKLPDEYLEQILAEILQRVAVKTESQKDKRRLNEICGCPAKYGFSSPSEEQRSSTEKKKRVSPGK